MVSVRQDHEVLKVIVANPIMIETFKAGIRGNTRFGLDGSGTANLQWKPKKSTEALFAVDVRGLF